MKIKLLFLLLLTKTLLNLTIMPNFLHNKNNDRIKDNYSLKENTLAYGLFLTPLLYQYWGLPWSNRGRRIDGETNSIKDHLTAEFENLWKIKEIIKNTFTGDNKLKNFFTLLNNTFIRGALVYYLLPRILHTTESTHKYIMNEYHKELAKILFYKKKDIYHKQQEFHNQLKKNDTKLSSLLNQLISENPNIIYRLSKIIKNDSHNSPNNNIIIIHKKAKKKLYKDLIEIKQVLNKYNDSIDIESHEKMASLQEDINRLNIDDSLKDSNFIKKNYQAISKLSDIKAIKSNIFPNEPLQKILLPIQPILSDIDYITRDSDITPENSWNEYKDALENTVETRYPYPYSSYVNKDQGYKPWFDEENYIVKLD